MAEKLLFRFIYTLFLIFSTATFAQNVGDSGPRDVETIIDRYDLDAAYLRQLSNSKQWLHLLHYHQVGFTGFGESQADDSSFFLSKTGSVDPYDELISNIYSLTTNSQDSQCKFPARTHWLKKQLTNLEFETALCPEFDKWKHEINAEDLSLIFPAAYLNSPSSMFGHTLMRLDSASHDNALLDYTVNYAANADPDDNELVFTYKGLAGGYPGLFSVLPYYEKVKEYSFLEARDVWEYELDISREELDQFIRHVWELKDIKFDYYFFTENCSYHLLTLLDASSERFDLSAEFTTDVIPADTVRVLNDQGLIKEARFRPSTLTVMKGMSSQLSESQAAAVNDIVNNSYATRNEIEERISKFSETERSQILELAYRYSRYQALESDKDSGDLAKTSLALLSARSKLERGDVYQKVPTPEVRDDEGHFSHRHKVSWGEDAEAKYTEYGLRMSYHDWLDNIDGYLPGAQLEIGEIEFRHLYEDKTKRQDDETRVETIGLINIASLSGRDRFFKPLSWFVSTGFDRQDISNQTLSPYLRGGAAYSYQFGSHILSTAIANSTAISAHINKGYHFSVGPRFIWLYQTGFGSISLVSSALYDLSASKEHIESTELGISLPISKHWQLRTESEYSETRISDSQKDYSFNWNFSLIRYF